MGSEGAELPVWARTPCVMGIDEAGRGPVLGPMVYGCAYCALTELERLSTLEFADSKTLTKAKREELFESIKSDSSFGWSVDIVDARDLSARMLSRTKESLNVISFESAMGLIKRTLDLGYNLAEVYVDTVGEPIQYQERLIKRFPGLKFVVTAKADSLFPIVSAASIVAKVTRDKALESWVMPEVGMEIGREFGSGYPGDPVTKAWLQEHRDPIFGFPSLVRFSWSTSATSIAEAGVDIVWEAEDDDMPMKKSRLVQVESAAAFRHSYFRSRQLQQIVTHF